MKGDFTRNTFNPKKHYSSVLMQQGRVQLDADWNEQGEIQDYRDRLTHIDVIGHCGGPMGKAPDGSDLAGFKLTDSGGNLLIHKGRYYVDGILCENEADVLLDAQPDLPDFNLADLKPGPYLAYLDVWERHITVIEDPEIREVALGGPDTATRKKVIWQVKLYDAKGGKEVNCASFGKHWAPNEMLSTGKLAARAEPDPESDDPCVVPPDAGYRRLENQLYRVEIHKAGGVGTATYKWSRENGSIVAKWTSQDGDKLLVNTVGRDDVLRFSNGDWVELTDDTRELNGRPGLLVKVLKVEGLALTIDPATVQNAENPADTTIDFEDFPLNPKIRRWESEGAEQVRIPGTNDGWLLLEDGVQVKFEAGGAYQTGDYWTIPARANEGDVLWPKEGPACDPVFTYAFGIKHHYCKLAVAVFNGKSWDIEDCRNLFPPLTEIDLDTCCEASVGDGVRSTGKFTDIQEAVDSLGEEGGTVCILPGIYQLEAPVVIRGKDIRVEGCGKRAAVLGADDAPAFVIDASYRVQLDGLVIRASADKGAVLITSSKDIDVTNCDVVNRRKKGTNPPKDPKAMSESGMMLKRPLIRERYMAEEGQLDAGGRTAAGPAIFVWEASRVLVERNFLHGFGTVCGLFNDARILNNHATGGGIWVMDGSLQVVVQGNRIFDGPGAGVILGGLVGNEASERGAGVQWVDIIDNRIFRMSGSGISTIAESEEGLFGDIEEVAISGNQIIHCVDQPPDAIYNSRAAGGVVIENATSLRIHNNLIVENGRLANQSAVGIFLDTAFGVSLHGNEILDNGTAENPEKDTLVDFSAMDPGSQLENPYNASDSVRLTGSDADGNVLPGLTIGSSDVLIGLQCAANNVFELAEPVDRVIVRMVIESDGSAKVTALGENGVIDEQTTTQPPGTIEQLTLQGDGIQQVEITTTSQETLLGSIRFTDFPETFQGGVIGLFVLSSGLESEDEGASFHPGSPAFEAQDNTIITPAGQALLLVGLGPILVNGNTLTTQGPWFQPIREEKASANSGTLAKQALQGGKCLSILNLGQAAEIAGMAAMLGKLDRFDGWTKKADGTGDGAGIPTAFSQGRSLYFDGRVLCTDNQMTYSNPSQEGDILETAFTIISLDDVSLIENQMSSLTGSFRLVTSGVMAATARISGNRISELPLSTFISCMSLGYLANTTMGNQSTHCLLVMPGTLNNNIVNEHNIVLIPVFCGD